MQKNQNVNRLVLIIENLCKQSELITLVSPLKGKKNNRPGMRRIRKHVGGLELISKMERKCLFIHFFIYSANIFECLSLSNRDIYYIVYLALLFIKPEVDSLILNPT